MLDGVIQITDHDHFGYSEMMAHLPLMAHIEGARNVLVVGGGDGAVLTEVLKHKSVEQAVLCELDAGVMQVSKKHFPRFSHAFDDHRTTIVLKDATKYVREMRGVFDVIICDSSDPVGPAQSLFEPAFYEDMRLALRPNGIICAQGECMWLHRKLIKEILKAGKRMFQDCRYAFTTIPTYPSGQIGFVLATTDSRVDVSKPARSLKDALGRKTASQLLYYNKEVHKASFVLPTFVRDDIN